MRTAIMSLPLALLSLALPVGAQGASETVRHGPAKPISGSVIALAKRCAPNVHPLTMAYLVANESSNRRYAINVNDGEQLTSQPGSLAEAKEAIEQLERKGVNYDVGYGQINSSNFDWVGASGVELFDACTNLRASQQVLMDCYKRALNGGVSPQTALRDALSCYNTGSMEAGYANGYVASVESIADTQQVPELLPGRDTRSSEDGDVQRRSKQQNESGFGEPDAFASESNDAFSMGGDDEKNG